MSGWEHDEIAQARLEKALKLLSASEDPGADLKV